jgi:hypothetical protein
MSKAIRKAVGRRWTKQHTHRCPECGYHTECRDDECVVEDARVGGGYDGDERECSACLRFPFSDLRAVTRESERYLTRVKLYHDHFRSKEWFIMGQARLTKQARENGPSRWTFDAYLAEGATDFEHDSAYAIRMGLIGVEFKSIYYGHTEVVAVIDPIDFDGFCVPPPGYNPMKLPDAEKCEDDHCKGEPHIIVPEGHYVPPNDAELFKKVRGRFIEITFGVPPKGE